VKEAELADGTILEFPDDTDDAVIQAAVKKLISGQVEKPGFMDMEKQDLAKRSQQMQEIEAARKSGTQGRLESGWQGAGVGAGMVSDLVGNAAVSGYNELPEAVTGPINATAKKIASYPLGNPYIAGALQKTSEVIENVKTNSPRTYRNLATPINVLGIMSPAAAAKPTPKGLASMGGEKLAKWGDNQATKQTEKVAAKLVEPKSSKIVKEQQVGRTTVNKFGTKVVEPSTLENMAAKEVAKVKGVKEGNILQKNYNIIQEEVRKEADNLLTTLDKNNVPLAPKDYRDALANVQRRLDEDINITGNNKSVADKILTKYAQIINGKPKTAADLLRSRQELDRWIKSQKGEGVFDPTTENAITSAVRIIRQESNDLVDRKVTNVDVKGSLRKQTNLLNAMDNIGPKAAEEAATAVGRLVQRVGKVTGLKETGSKVLAAASIPAVGSAAAFAPALAATALTGLFLVKGGKMVLGPGAKKTLGTILKKTDEALKKVNDVEAIKAIQKDRALVMDLIHNAQEEEPQK